ncbi:excinuclease ABC subunit A [Pasteurella oralis]|uniref:Excinuclease ABC subunit A n=1 Tax=Pasteurella oralis TaxID=1071947 RepID=A0ABW4NRB0_9PAST|nr:excinuclease ABC subunit A [Pasteurella oralis]
MTFSKTFIFALSAIILSACAPRNTTHYFSIDEALQSPAAANVLNPNVKLYFGKQAPGKVLKSDLVSNRKTNAANKDDKEACEWAFLSAVRSFQDRAQSMGATKVGNLISYYKKNPYKSTTQFECHAGHLIGGVALKGDIVK